MPCESMPQRLVCTRLSATSRASPSATPAARRQAVPQVIRRSAGQGMLPAVCHLELAGGGRAVRFRGVVWKRPLTVIFQPHRYSRTRDLFDEFLTAFEGADRLILTEIYPAGEDAMPGINSESLYQAIKRQGHMEVEFMRDKNQIAKALAEKLNPGDIALTMGAGDIYKVGEALVEALKESGSNGVLE